MTESEKKIIVYKTNLFQAGLLIGSAQRIIDEFPDKPSIEIILRERIIDLIRDLQEYTTYTEDNLRTRSTKALLIILERVTTERRVLPLVKPNLN